METWKRGGTKDRDNPRLLTTPDISSVDKSMLQIISD